MAPTMHPNPANDFLPARASRHYEDTGDDDFDMARFSAIRKDQKGELDRVDHHFNSNHATIEGQIRNESDQLFQHFQAGMQRFYTDLTKTITATVENKVQLRLEQERLRVEHEAKKVEVKNRYQHEASKLIISTPQEGRQPGPFPKLPSQGLIPNQGPIPSQGSSPSNRGPSPSRPQGFASSRGLVTSQVPVHSQATVPSNMPRSNSNSFTATNVSRQGPPAPVSSNQPQAHQHQRVQQRSLINDDQPRESVLQQGPRHEYTAQIPTPLPTPEERIPVQRRPVPSEPRAAEHRAIEPRPVESRSAGPRRIVSRPSEPRAIEPSTFSVEPSVDQRTVEKRPAEQRPADQRPAEQRPMAQRLVDQHPVNQRPIEKHPVEKHPVEKHPVEKHPVEKYPAEQRPTEQLSVDQRPVEQHPMEPGLVEPRAVEQRPVEQRPVEQHPVEQRPVEQHPVEQRPVEQHSVEQPHVQAMTARSTDKEPETVDQVPPVAPSSEKTARRLSHVPTGTTPRHDTKRKAAESTTTVTAVPAPKRPRTGDTQTDGGHEQSSAVKQSPRSTRHLVPASQPLAQRTISFQEVYQNGKGQFKHKIFPWPKDSSDYYIVRCDEHQVHFNIGNPIHGAAKHIHSPQHGTLEKKHDLAIQICGHYVTGCTAELAELNNKEFKRALDVDNYQVFNMNLLTKEGKRRLTDTPVAKGADTPTKPATGDPAPTNTTSEKKKPKALKRPLGEVTPPKECEFHLGFWSPTKSWYMLIVLPIRDDGSLREVGLRQRLQETDLMSNVPKCYSTSRLSLQIKGFQAAYADGGPKADKREYPVMFFDSRVQRHALAWLPGSRLKQVDLNNPPDHADERQVSLARQWYATRMMHRSSWEEFKRLGPGETRSPTSSEGEAARNYQWLSLRSARTDEMSPIHDKSSGPGHFFASGSSDAESSEDEANDDVEDDAEDFMKMDIGPIPEPADSNYVEEDSDVEMEDVARPDESDANNDIRPRRRGTNWSSRRRSRAAAQEINMDEDETQGRRPPASRQNATEAENGIHAAGLPQTSETDQSQLQKASSKPSLETDRQPEMATVPCKQDQLRDSVQAKAVAAILEAASRSRASSENPETAPQQNHGSQIQARGSIASRPPFADHNRSRSEDTLGRGGAATFTAAGTSKLNETHNAGVSTSAGIENTTASHADPYEKFEAIKAAMSQAQMDRAASAPAPGNDKTAPPSSPPLPPAPTGGHQQKSPKASQMASPPLSQPSTVIPARSLSTTPTNGVDSGRSTPKIVIPDVAASARWKVVRGNSGTSLQESRATSDTPSDVNSLSAKSTGTSVETPSLPETQLGTPIHDKQESFDVSQFEDSGGTSWTRAGPNARFLRLVTDSMRKWAEATSGSPVKTTIEPAQIERIVTEHPDGSRDKLRMHVYTKLGRRTMLMFETNSANGRSQGAALQGRKFVSWVKANNENVEWVDDTGSRPDSRRNTPK